MAFTVRLLWGAKPINGIQTAGTRLLNHVLVQRFSSCQCLRAHPVSIQTHADERTSGNLGERNLEKAVRHIKKDGIVVVENVIDHSILDTLNERMVQDAKELRSRGENSPFNYNKGNLQQDPPPVKQFFFPEIFTSLFPPIFKIPCEDLMCLIQTRLPHR